MPPRRIHFDKLHNFATGLITSDLRRSAAPLLLFGRHSAFGVSAMPYPVRGAMSARTTAAQWRERADEARSAARLMNGKHSRESMLVIARSYDTLAKYRTVADLSMPQPFQFGDKVHVRHSRVGWDRELPEHELYYVVGIMVTETGDFDIWIGDHYPLGRGELPECYRAEDLAPI